MKKERNPIEMYIVRGLICLLAAGTFVLLFLPYPTGGGRGFHPRFAEAIIVSMLPVLRSVFALFGYPGPESIVGASAYPGGMTSLEGGFLVCLSLLLLSTGTGLLWSGIAHRRWHSVTLLLIGALLMGTLGMTAPPMALMGFYVLLLFRSLSRSLLGNKPLVGGYISGFSIGSLSLVVMMFGVILSSEGNQPQYSIPIVGTATLQYLAILGIFLIAALLKLNTGLIPRWIRMPGRLPRLRPRRMGFTLIELLIVVAIIAITVPMVAQLFRTASQTSQRSRDAQQAARLARNEIERLRGGVHAMEPGMRAETVEGLPMEVLVAAPREDGLVPVTITFTIGPESAREPLAFSTLIPPAREASDATN